MYSRHSTRRCSPRYWSGLELPKQKAARNTGSGEHLACASFLQLLARRSKFRPLCCEQQGAELQREILKFLFTRPELTHPLFLLSASSEAARRRTRYALVATE